MDVFMVPSATNFSGYESGIKRVVEAYAKYLPDFGIKLVGESSSYDIRAVHAGMTGGECEVAILHGLYWTADYEAPGFEYKANANIVEAVRSARQITVPSAWVAEVLQRDMRLTPHIVPHGIDTRLWDDTQQSQGYVLWNKNRDRDVCNINHLAELAKRSRDIGFVSTFKPDGNMYNVIETGIVKHSDMKDLVERCSVYLSTTKETFGIGVLEAMASGKPVLGFRYGGNIDLIQHGVNGYLAEPNDYDDLERGLRYCMDNASVLGKNGRELANMWTWKKAVEKMAEVLYLAGKTEPPSVSVIIPVYNYKSVLPRAVDAVLAQTRTPKEIIIVDDGSTDHPDEVFDSLISSLNRKSFNGTKPELTIIRQKNAGVAVARNAGIAKATSKYVCCLDADDAIEPEFLDLCVKALEDTPSLSIAYTSLRWIKPDGATGVSEWPGKFSYDGQLQRRNQIPTCCVFKKEMWERLGGYKQRYAPSGAGAEDAEFWLRAGAYGFDAQKVTELPLFLYSWMSGRVSGNKDYKETDWLAWHPWTRDQKHPFASLATPKRMSHEVRQYDEPDVSVIIPVGPNHEKTVITALDSLEAQTFRRWEAILVWDSPNKPDDLFLKAYPYAKIFYTNKPLSGPGTARNIGVGNSRGHSLVFLDADDWLYPEAIEKMISERMSNEAIVYSDYVGKSYIDPDSISQFKDRLLSYNEKTNEAVMLHKSAAYNCEDAQKQPVKNTEPYHWCLVTCMIPKAWHLEIGGFDEKMETWEDVDYHWRMARAGKCYTRIEEPLVVYHFATGNRREIGNPYNGDSSLQTARKLLSYMASKYEDIKIMPCFRCGQNSQPPEVPVSSASRQATSAPSQMSDENFIEILYTHPNRGDHQVVGPSTGINYGYRGGGETFLVHKADIALSPNLFSVKSVVAVPKVSTEIAPTPAPVSISVTEKKVVAPTKVVEAESVETSILLESLPGITENIAKQLKDKGVTDLDGLIALGQDGIEKLRNVGNVKARVIFGAAVNLKKQSNGT